MDETIVTMFRPADPHGSSLLPLLSLTALTAQDACP